MRGSNRLVTQYHVIDSVKSSKAIKSMLHVSLIVLIGSDDKVRIVKKLGLVLRTACRHNHQLFLTGTGSFTTREGLPLVVDWVSAKEVQSGLYE